MLVIGIPSHLNQTATQEDTMRETGTELGSVDI